MDELLKILRAFAGAPPLELLGLVLARLMPVVTFAPVFGGAQTPALFRIGLGIMLAISLAPVVGPRVVLPPSGLDYAAAFAGELLLGLTIAVGVRALFEAVSAAGDLIDEARGAKLAEAIDPWTQSRASVLGPFLLQFQLAIFAGAGGLRLLLDAFARGFVVVPAGGVPAAASGEAGIAAAAFLGGQVVLLSCRIAAPALAVLFVVEAAFALVNRVAPIGPGGLSFLTPMVKPAVGIAVVLLGLGAGAAFASDGLGRLILGLMPG